MTILSPTTKTATVRSTFGGSPLTVHYGGDYIYPGQILLDEPRQGHYDGVALRDALLEAFPLPKDEPLADWEKELLGVKTEPEFLDVVPGMVIVDRKHDGGYTRVTLLNGRYYNVEVGVLGYWNHGAPRAEDYKVAFDPRDAVALPNPLGIRVGDRVRRTNVSDKGPGRALYTNTTEFEVNHIDGATGSISPKYGAITYNPKGFEVTSREVPDRLPAGTIVRLPYDGIRLITNEGGIHLTGYVNSNPAFRDASDYAAMVKRGDAEVIYLP